MRNMHYIRYSASLQQKFINRNHIFDFTTNNWMRTFLSKFDDKSSRATSSTSTFSQLYHLKWIHQSWFMIEHRCECKRWDPAIKMKCSSISCRLKCEVGSFALTLHCTMDVSAAEKYSTFYISSLFFNLSLVYRQLLESTHYNSNKFQTGKCRRGTHETKSMNE